MQNMIVIGAGVIGLSTAIRLLETGYGVIIISREHPQETTSSVAGAIWAGYGLGEVRQKWASKSLSTFQALAENPDTGVNITRYHEIFPYKVDSLWYSEVLDFCQAIPKDQLPEGYVSGYVSDVPLVQSPKYLQYLLTRFESLGGILEIEDIASLSDLSEHPLIVNCSGVGARQLANDAAVHPIWGQVLLVHAPYITEAIIDDEAFTYVYPRQDGVVLGGIHVHDKWEREPDSAITEDIIARCKEICPVLDDVTIKKILVGLRPGRDTVRLEVEQLTPDCTVIHNYGHGGVGYTLSWGCAEAAVELVKQVHPLTL